MDWDYIDEDTTPVVEVFSAHGCSETDIDPYPMLLGMGPRATDSTYRYALKKGLKLGIIAGTDDHRGYPGAYGEGLTGVYAKALNRKELFTAIKNKRTIGVTGDRIKIKFLINDTWMGGEIKSDKQYQASIDVAAEDFIERVEVIKNGSVLTRLYPEPLPREHKGQKPGRYKIRISWGWGSMGSREIIDWQGEISIKEGKFNTVNGYFRSAPFSEEKRHRITVNNENIIRWESFTSRQGIAESVSPDNSKVEKVSVLNNATHSLVMDVTGTPETILNFDITGKNRLKLTCTIGELLQESKVEFMRGYLSEAIKIHRAIPEGLFSLKREIDLTNKEVRYKDQVWQPAGINHDYYYLRVVQANGQLGWSSPIWVNY